MQLTKLELRGFKSFADKTEFGFGPGITVVVGPNGCGKSNIVDSVKWVLGEQGTKSLRASDMADVIFSGNASRPSQGYAEVSATILNHKGLLPVEYPEVCISRRLYASGESEYYLNKQLCRLKDIKELLMDTGLGINCYSLIEQGQVDVLLQANAQERRVVFEEAAGISKYKAKKKATVSRLEKTEQNLLRLGDIVEEVQKQLRSVKLQAAKARKYREYTDRLKDLKIQWSLKTFRELEAKQQEVLSKVAELYARCKTVLSQKESLGQERAGLEEKHSRIGEHLAQIHTELVTVASQITNSRDKISLDVQRIKELEFQRTKAVHHVEVLEEKLEELKNRHVTASGELAETTQEITTLQEALERQRLELDQVNRELGELQEELERKKSQAIDALKHQSRLQNDIDFVNHERQSLGNRRTRLESRLASMSQEMGHLHQEKITHLGEKERTDTEIRDLEGKLTELASEEESLRGEVSSVDNTLFEKKNLLTAKQLRQEVLKDLEMKAFGVEMGTQTVLEGSRNCNGTSLQGICGIVADILKVDLPNALAIETALGLKVQAVITNTTQDAVRAISHLENTHKGRATFVPMDTPECDQNGPSITSEEGVVARAVDLVNPNNTYAPIVRKLLYNTIVVKDLSHALEISKRHPHARLVTLKGEIVEADGSIAGGDSKGQPGIISRRSELEVIERELSHMSNEIRSTEHERGELQKKGKELEDLVDGLKKRLGEFQMTRLCVEKDLHDKELKLKALEEEKEVNSAEIAETNKLLEQLSSKENALKGGLEEALANSKKIEDYINTATERLAEKQSRRSILEAKLTENKVTLASKQEKKYGLSETLARLEESTQEAQREHALNLQEKERCEGKKIETQKDIDTLETLTQELEEKKAVLQSEQTAKEEEAKNVQDKLTPIAEKMLEKDREYDALQKETQELRLKEKEFEIKRTDLEERLREEYKVQVSEIKAEEVDWTAATQEMEELRGKIEKIGNVNLEALEEQEQLEIRERFLLNQQEDLVKAKNSLSEIIRTINQTCRERFEKSFEEIRENFNTMYRKLFGGGKSHIYLEEGVDILDAGIEIVAQPPGKELRSISLLSGGEKSLTAVALLFAIFQTKPSPFCILDEVDAALDESNIVRFAHVVKEFTENSQFIIITHNKRTMAIGDTLYGVTMEESGISKKVAVKLEEIEKQKGLVGQADKKKKEEQVQHMVGTEQSALQAG
ncbi:MAG: chromosome segregation protein SMC [Candidatus Brocadiales bacterium]|nr:chromosome segregation protein SMC [Candidatus Brocadiales bacterium]